MEVGPLDYFFWKGKGKDRTGSDIPELAYAMTYTHG